MCNSSSDVVDFREHIEAKQRGQYFTDDIVFGFWFKFHRSLFGLLHLGCAQALSNDEVEDFEVRSNEYNIVWSLLNLFNVSTPNITI